MLSFLLLGLGLGAQTATGISGLYYSSVNNNGALLTTATTDPHWNVTYASTDNGATQNATYQGAAHVVTNTTSGWIPDTTNAGWITAPNAGTNTAGDNPNTGATYLPGWGTATATSEIGLYVYTLAFTIAGTGTAGTTVPNNVALSLTMAADDQFRVYLNPTGNGTTRPTGTAAGGDSSEAWKNTTSIVLANYASGLAGQSVNSTFKIGTNYLVVVVENTNNGRTVTHTNFNPSGLLFYQQNQNILIDGQSISIVAGHSTPETGTWIPAVAALVLAGGWYGLRRYRAQRPDRGVPAR